MVLFEVYPAELQVSCPGVAARNLAVEIDTTIFGISRYVPEGNTNEAYFTLSANITRLPEKIPFSIRDKATGKTLKKLVFSYIPEHFFPIACVGNTTSGTISKADLLAQTGLRIRYTHPLLNYPYHVMSFSFIANFSGNSYNIQCSGSWFSQLEAVFKLIPPHTKIAFADIICTCSDCSLVSIRKLELTVL